MGWEACHPVHGLIWAEVGVAERLARFMPPSHPLGRLMGLLFHQTEAVEFAPTRRPRRAATWLGPKTLGRLTAQLAAAPADRQALAEAMGRCPQLQARRRQATQAFAHLARLGEVALAEVAELEQALAADRARQAELEQQKLAAKHALGRARQGGGEGDARAAQAGLDAAWAALREGAAAGHQRRGALRGRILGRLQAMQLDPAALLAVSALDGHERGLAGKLRRVLATADPGDAAAAEGAIGELAAALAQTAAVSPEGTTLATKALTAFGWRGCLSTEGGAAAFAAGVAEVAAHRPPPAQPCPLAAEAVVARQVERRRHRFFPPLCVTALSRAADNSVVFPDCGESSVRNFFNVLLHHQGRLEVGRLRAAALPFHPKLIAFYTAFPDAETIRTQAAHNAWARVVARLSPAEGTPPIRYLSPRRGSFCELGAGGRNVLRLLEALTGTADVAAVVAHIAQPAGLEVRVDLAAFDPDDRSRQDGSNRLVLDFGAHRFEWSFMPRHFRTRVMGPDAESADAVRRQRLAEVAAGTGSRALDALGTTPLLDGLEGVAVPDLAARLGQGSASEVARAELVLAADLDSIDALDAAIWSLLDDPAWQAGGLLPALLGGMAVALPRHPDHHAKRFRLAEAIAARPGHPLAAVLGALRDTARDAWVDTRDDGDDGRAAPRAQPAHDR